MENQQQQLPPPPQQQQQQANAPLALQYQQQAPAAVPFHHLLQQQNQQLQMFWSYQRQEVAHATDFKNHQLPLARIKKIMKADEDVRMISAEAPVLFAKACELFILELTIRSWLHAEENKRRTLQKNDVAAAIARTDIFDFLVDIVPRDEAKDEAAGASATGVPYYYPPIGAAAGAVTGVMMGQPPGIDPSAYMQRPPLQPWQPLWAQQGMAMDGGFSAGPGMDVGQGDAVHPPPPPPPHGAAP